MATILGKPQVELKLVLQLSEAEARALYDLTGYGTDKFLEAFYEFLGAAYLKKNEDGLRTLFDSVREQVPIWLRKAESARDEFSGPIRGQHRGDYEQDQ